MRRALIILAAALPAVCHPEIFEGRVTAITDGDTLAVLDGMRIRKIRLAGIDAPEKSQPFGMRAKSELSTCAFGKTVAVEWRKTDRYRRLVGKVFADDTDCGLRQIELGLAWHYTRFAKEQSSGDRLRYARAQAQARDAREGLWASPDPVAPWDWRKGQRKLAD